MDREVQGNWPDQPWAGVKATITRAQAKELDQRGLLVLAADLVSSASSLGPWYVGPSAELKPGIGK